MSQIWFTSDTHFGHDRDFIWRPRGFNSIYEMNETIIKNWNSVVQPDDEVYHLGDVMLGSEDNIKYQKQLKGNIHIVRGNHDSDRRLSLYDSCWNVVEIMEGHFLNYNDYHFYLSHFPTLTYNADDDGKPLQKKTISLCGHRHTQNKWYDWINGLIYHVELDCHDNKVVSIDDIITDLRQMYYINKEN